MKNSLSRRYFIKTSVLTGAGLSLSRENKFLHQTLLLPSSDGNPDDKASETDGFIPYRTASWWCTLEDLLWPQKKIVDRIRYRAEAFANAGIDTAINFGFHVRFDFSNYFGQLHGYLANVCEELHRYNIRFMDHYSCNHIERPRGEVEFRKLHKNHRHHILLFHDPVAADYAQYEGHFFKDICQVSFLDGSRGYAKQYQLETFCHNNPGFLDMHRKYLLRLLNDVPVDGVEVDDMCDYAGPLVCGCIHCRERFKRDYGHDIPGLDDAGFWGDTKETNEFLWGNYENPVFRDWLRMRADSVADHLRMVKEVVKDKPLMTCCSSSGPVYLNALDLNLERMSPYLDFFMLENCGINVNTVDWVRMDSEALHQKDIARRRNNAPPLALSYTIYKDGGYLGWCLSRFWGVANWSSTLNQRLEEDPADMMEIEDIVGPYNNWEIKNSKWDYRKGTDLVEVRLVNSRYCRENGWLGEDGIEQWTKAATWSTHLVNNNIGYRFVRSEELSDASELCNDNTPLILDSIGCVSDRQFDAISTFLSKGGTAWIALPFGTHDEKGYKRPVPLSVKLLKAKYKNLIVIGTSTLSNPLDELIRKGKFKPVIKQLKGDKRWALRIRFHDKEPVIHFLSRGLSAIPHPTIRDMGGTPILQGIETLITENELSYEIDSTRVTLPPMVVMSPESENRRITANIISSGRRSSVFSVNLEGIGIYAVMQPAE